MQKQVHSIQNQTSIYYSSSLVTDSTSPYKLSYRGPRTQQRSLLGLYALNCKASSYYYDPRHLDFFSICYQIIRSYLSPIFFTIQSLDLFIQSHGPWTMDRPTLHYKIQGGKFYDLTYILCSTPVIRRVFQHYLTKTWV